MRPHYRRSCGEHFWCKQIWRRLQHREALQTPPEFFAEIKAGLWVREISPQIVEISVAVAAGGIVALAAEEPEFTAAVDPTHGAAARAGRPVHLGEVRTGQIAVYTVLVSSVGALDPSPSAGLAKDGTGSIGPQVIEVAVPVCSGGIEAPTAEGPEISGGRPSH